MNNRYSKKKISDAIQDSGGNISLIAKRVGCSIDTVRRNLVRHPELKTQYQDECDRILDMAESVVVKNIEIASETQKEGKSVDTSDARWWLSKKRPEYTEKVEITGGIELVIPEEKIEAWVDILTRSIGRTYSEDKSGK